MSKLCYSCSAEATHRCTGCDTRFCGDGCFVNIMTSVAHLEQCVINYQHVGNGTKGKRKRKGTPFPLDIEINNSHEIDLKDQLRTKGKITVKVNLNEQYASRAFSKWFISQWGYYKSLYLINLDYDTSKAKYKSVLYLNYFVLRPKMERGDSYLKKKDAKWLKGFGFAMLCQVLKYAMKEPLFFLKPEETNIRLRAYNVVDDVGTEPVKWTVNQMFLIAYYEKLGFRMIIPRSQLADALPNNNYGIVMQAKVSEVLSRCEEQWKATLAQAEKDDQLQRTTTYSTVDKMSVEED